jgi:hypothetical protein
MGPFDAFLHLSSFLAPVLAVACGVALAARLLLPRQSESRAWWVQAAINSIVGAAVLVAGLWYFGVDGKMATYSALVLAIASCQWVCGRAWRA